LDTKSLKITKTNPKHDFFCYQQNESHMLENKEVIKIGLFESPLQHSICTKTPKLFIFNHLTIIHSWFGFKLGPPEKEEEPSRLITELTVKE
jgi:hypothetical protein